MSEPARRVLVAGIGNIFLSDDGFGSEVAQRMVGTPVPDGVRVADFGIRGVHLAYELLDGYDALVLVDAMPMGEPPGTVAVLDADLPPPPGPGDDIAPTIEAHSMNPEVVLGMLASLGGGIGRVVVVGCQPSVIEEGMGLSAPVAEAVDRAVGVVGDVLKELCPTVERS
ncbi:MAG: hydrogenase maturation protease [Acidimicrobiia bacterium]